MRPAASRPGVLRLTLLAFIGERVPMDDSTSSAAFATRLANARDAFEAARYLDCLRFLEGISPEAGPGWEEALLMRVRAQLALRKAPEAIAEIAAFQEQLDGDWRIRLFSKLAVAHGVSRNYDLARETIEQARALKPKDRALVSEVGYAAGVTAWMAGDVDRAEGSLREAFADPSPARISRAHMLRAWVCAARGRYRDQLRDLLAALEYLARGKSDLLDLANLVSTLAYLGRDLYDQDAISAVTPYLERDFWDYPDFAEHRSRLLRGVAWFRALSGDEFTSMRLLRRAASEETAKLWRVWGLLDRAMLTAYLREPKSSADELWEAHDLVRRIDWKAHSGEEILLLATMAELFAQHNPAEAAAYAARYELHVQQITPALDTRTDLAIRARADHAHGVALAALDQPVPAKRLLTGAWQTFEAIGFQWRAALTALALHDLTGEPKWLQAAADRAKIVPRSWIAREVERRERASDGSPIRRLTPREREIFQALRGGYSTDEIAQRFYLHPQSVKKHIHSIFEKYGVKSRAELFARIMDATR